MLGGIVQGGLNRAGSSLGLAQITPEVARVRGLAPIPAGYQQQNGLSDAAMKEVNRSYPYSYLSSDKGSVTASGLLLRQLLSEYLEDMPSGGYANMSTAFGPGANRVPDEVRRIVANQNVGSPYTIGWENYAKVHTGAVDRLKNMDISVELLQIMALAHNNSNGRFKDWPKSLRKACNGA